MKDKYFFKLNKKNGYTIIETMIAVSVFLVVITFGMNTLLNANVVHQKSQNMRSEMDNLSFILEDMSRNLRTGSDFHCISPYEPFPTGTNAIGTNAMDNPRSCANGWGIAFESATGNKSNSNDQWVYYIGNCDNTGNNCKILRSTKGPSSLTNFFQLTPDEVKINPISSFSVLGAEPPPGDTQQPFVIIRLIGNIIYNGISTPFSLQTSVSQRLVDI